MIKDDYIQQLPSKEELAEYICNAPQPVTKRDVARQFKLKGQARVQVKNLLRVLLDEGAIEKGIKKTYQALDALPEACIVEITGLDNDGELLARPIVWDKDYEPPLIFISDKKRVEGNLAKGDQALVKLTKLPDNIYKARILRALEDNPNQVIGVFKYHNGNGSVRPTDKKNREEFFVPKEHIEKAENGDLVVAEQLPSSTKYPRYKKPVRIKEVLGKKEDPRLISLIAIHSHSIPTDFSKEVMLEAESLEEAVLEGKRVDMRDIPLVTIDGIDARDYDDAVFAEKDVDPKNKGGWHLMVAIADVSHYVRVGSALDKSAFERGNSTYFADRVVPMLPERLSNELCSLKPNVNRACIACHMIIDKSGKLLNYNFQRGLMKSAARLTYEEVEAAHEGSPCDKTIGIYETIIKPLYQAYSILRKAREVRGALDIEVAERTAVIDDTGTLTAILPKQKLKSHQLVEEFMVLANVAAARALEDKKAPCVYRVHDTPAPDRLETTRDFLKEIGYSLPKTSDIKPKNLNAILKKSEGREDKELIHTLILRTQSAAIYSPDNLGHFGLALDKYAHFTSPIRRYADLLVHRSLVKSHKLGDGGLTKYEAEGLGEIADHISITERRSMMAERDVMDRFTAQYLSKSIGEEFKGKINGVTHFGLFVTLDETGADGIVPIRTLPQDFYIHDEKHHQLIGKRTRNVYKLAQKVVVRLVEANPLTGSTVFEIAGSYGMQAKNKPRVSYKGKKKPFDRYKKKSKNKRGNKRNFKNKSEK